MAALFEAEGVTLTLLYLFCGPLALTFFFNGALFVSNAAFNNLGHPFYSTWLNWGRHTLGTVPFVMVGAAWLGASGVLIGQAVGGMVFSVIAAVLAQRVIRKEVPGANDGMPEDYRREARFMTLFHARR